MAKLGEKIMKLTKSVLMRLIKEEIGRMEEEYNMQSPLEPKTGQRYSTKPRDSYLYNKNMGPELERFKKEAEQLDAYIQSSRKYEYLDAVHELKAAILNKDMKKIEELRNFFREEGVFLDAGVQVPSPFSEPGYEGEGSLTESRRRRKVLPRRR